MVVLLDAEGDVPELTWAGRTHQVFFTLHSLTMLMKVLDPFYCLS